MDNDQKVITIMYHNHRPLDLVSLPVHLEAMFRRLGCLLLQVRAYKIQRLETPHRWGTEKML
jgi:hypothetical protein